LRVNELVELSHLQKPGYLVGIWKLKTPSKVKNLIWRMCRGCLPTRGWLLDKGVHCPTQCVSCDSNYEDLAHIFYEFPFVVQVWSMAGLWRVIQGAVAMSPSAIKVIFTFLQSPSLNVFSTFCCTLLESLEAWEYKGLGRCYENLCNSG